MALLRYPDPGEEGFCMFKAGDRIKVIQPLLSGWTGYATVIAVDVDIIRFRKDDSDPDDFLADRCFCLIEDVEAAQEQS